MPDAEQIDVHRLEHYAPQDFRCSREAQQEFLLERAIRDQAEDISRTFIAYRQGVVVGYFTVAMDAIPLFSQERPSPDIRYPRLPALKLCQMAVDSRWEKRGIGKQLVAEAVAIALELRPRVGCRYLTLDAATPDLARWYASQDFVENKLDQRERIKRAKEREQDERALAISMRLDLQHVLTDLQEHYPRDFPRE